METKLTAKDLMIGDWVLCVDSTHKNKTYAQIDAIEEGQMCILVKKDKCNWFLDISYIEAIPLTAEILDKNFEQHPFDDYPYYDIKNDLHIRNAYDSIYLAQWIDTDTSLYQVPHYILDINYIHELQHILHQLGLNKEIVL